MKFLGKFVLLLSAPCASVMYRRPVVPGGRVQMSSGDPSAEDSAGGWVSAPGSEQAFVEPPRLMLCDGGLPRVRLAPFGVRPAGAQSSAASSSTTDIVVYEPPVSIVPFLPPPPPRAPRKEPKAWEEEATQKVKSSDVRAEARDWLTKVALLGQVRPFSTSSYQGKPTIVAKCGRCSTCSKEWSFWIRDGTTLVVMVVGECGGDLQLERVKVENARKY